MIISFSILLFVMWVALADIRHYADPKYGLFISSLAKYYIWIFIIVDVVYNFTVGTLLFWQWPSFQAPTLSERLRLILRDSDELGWRWKLAYMTCRRFVSPWDWNHCGVGLG